MAARPSPKLDAAVAGVGPSAFAAGCDVTKAAETERAVAAVVRACGGVDALVNCASVTRTGTADSSPETVLSGRESAAAVRNTRGQRP